MPNFARVLAKFCINPVVFSTMTPTSDPSGDSGGVPDYSAGTSLLCSLQPLSLGRIVAHQAEGSLATAQLFFAALPLDTSSGARPGGACRVRDRFVAAGRTFYAVGPVRDEGGGGVAWSVDCEERA